MADTIAFHAADKASRYRELLPQLAALLDGEPDLVANLANATAAIRACVPIASWVGFYVRRAREETPELVLGPFQGNVACVRIALGRGVCGTAAAERRTVIVPDVEAFPGHIACDAGSRSEIVVPVLAPDGRLVAVLDLDSYELAAFDDVDAAGLAPIAELLGKLAW
ncbi:MAG: GAF domain-containing protein [Deltaproteobacteria bacterium]|nr:GAF domain-containing protein [Deltaproteobacteria bacterium]MCW5809354.1 GAF domain-containing protein [Deltaproteobacteria bacterium]